MDFCRFFNNHGFCTNCGKMHDGSFYHSGAYDRDADYAPIGSAVARESAALDLAEAKYQAFRNR